MSFLRDDHGERPGNGHGVRARRDRSGRRLRASAHGRRPGSVGVPSPVQPSGAPPAGWWLRQGVKAVAIVMLASIAFLGSSRAYINFAADLPDAHGIGAEPLPADTLIFSADGQQLADLHPGGYRHYDEALSAMGPLLPSATISVEDANFYHEPGIDVGGIIRAAWIDWREHRPAQGASTITQQLVKLRLTKDTSPSVERKIKEAVLAVQVERAYSKQQILEMYLNTVFYGNDSYGSAAAAMIYFHTTTAKLDLAQASMLAGIPQNPTYNNPFANFQGAKARQRQVLDAMVRNHAATVEEADKAFAEDLSPPDHMFHADTQVLTPAFVSYVSGLLRAKYGDTTVYRGGLRVTTTINYNLEQVAQKTVTDQVNKERSRNLSQGALVSLDPKTGAVLAMVGSANPDANGGQFNMSVLPRNPGSSMKIFNYTAAIDSGRFTMVTPIADSPIRIRIPGATEVYEPKNYDQRYHGTCQLQQCMGNSLNVPAVKVELAIGVPAVVNEARKMGAPPYDEHGRQDGPADGFGPSLTLGGYTETVLQMATGASVLGAQGVLHPPFAITRITTADGTEVFKADDPAKNAKQVLDPKVAWIMETIMSDDDNRAMIFGRGSPLTLPGRRVGAKTGTTDNFTDGWTVGYTPSIATAVWMGNPNFSAMVPGSDGVFVAAPAWHNFMQAALDAMKIGDEWYPEPPGLGHANVGGKVAYFLPGTSPSTPAPQLPSWAQTGGNAPAPKKP